MFHSRGGDINDCRIYRSETQPWRQAHVKVFPSSEIMSFAEGVQKSAWQIGGRRFRSFATGTLAWL
jgi:hypothetical protein